MNEARAVGETAAQVEQDLLALGVRPRGAVLVHSSLSALGYVPGGPETVILGLLQALGPEGTLLLPALSYESVGPQQPVFDVRNTPACVGAIPEHFRTRPGTRRSLHPTHSICGVGPLAETLLGEHHLGGTPCGSFSPFRKLRDVGGQVMFLGCGLRPNTSMHGVEELVEPPYLFGEMVAYRVIGADGSEIAVWSRRHNHGPCGVRQRYDRIEPLLKPGRELRIGTVLEARTHLLEAGPMWREGVAALQRDPYFFVDRV